MIRTLAALLCFCAVAVATAVSAPNLRWNVTQQEHRATPGETKAEFVFTVHNAGAAPAVITSVRTSCGCTVAGFPHLPWTIAAGDTSELHATLDFHGKWGEIEKAIFVAADGGVTTLTVKVDAGDRPPVDTAPLMARAANIQVASADRQAVFTNHACAECHARSAEDQSGRALYQAGCAICHDSPRRAAMVPDLHALTRVPDPAALRDIIAGGKPSSLMPAFSRTQGGPRTEAQIDSLVDYLSRTLRPVGHTSANPPAVPHPSS